MNENDEKMKTSITKEEDKRSILVIGRIQIFLPSNQGEASIFIAEVATKGQQVETIIEEKEQVLKSAPMEEEHQVESLNQ